MTARTVEDRLREAYFDLLPDVRSALVELEAMASHAVMPISLKLRQRHERLILRSRVKDCESAINSLRRREEAKEFDPAQAEKYRLGSLPDLAGVRVFVFPSLPIESVREAMESTFPGWEADHVKDDTGTVLAWKHHGYCPATPTIRCEYQIVPMLIGLFWDVEHAAIYKPDRSLIGVTRAPAMQARTQQVYAALRDFEEEFTRQIEAARE